MNPLKPNSYAITDGPSRAGARAMFKAVGFTDDDLRRPLVGVANTWTEIRSCNFHLRRLAAKTKEGIRRNTKEAPLEGGFSVRYCVPRLRRHFPSCALCRHTDAPRPSVPADIVCR